LRADRDPDREPAGGKRRRMDHAEQDQRGGLHQLLGELAHGDRAGERGDLRDVAADGPACGDR
jgi:hypothetical protein